MGPAVGALQREATRNERRTLGKLNTAAGAVFAESARLPLDLTEVVEEDLTRQ
jgi:hypothetical protein